MFTSASLTSVLALLSLAMAAPAESDFLAKRDAGDPVPTGKAIFPSYLVPVQPGQTAPLGSVFEPTIVSGQAVDVAFDVPVGGTTCDLFFHLPGTGGNPGNGVSTYKLTGGQQFTAQQLTGPVDVQTTWDNRPAVFGDKYSFTLIEGVTQFIARVKCGEGHQQGFEFSAVNDAAIKWFEVNANPSVGVILWQH